MRQNIIANMVDHKRSMDALHLAWYDDRDREWAIEQLYYISKAFACSFK